MIKKFENFKEQNSEYYKEITSQEAIKFAKKIDCISEYEFSKIKKYINDKNIDSSIYIKIGQEKEIQIKIIPKNNNTDLICKEITINKYTDEWFLFTVRDIMSIELKWTKQHSKYKWYICDQLDGVIRLISDI